MWSRRRSHCAGTPLSGSRGRPSANSEVTSREGGAHASWQEHALRLLRISNAPNAIPPTAVETDGCTPACLEKLLDRKIDSLYYGAVSPGSPVQRLYDAIWSAQERVCASVLADLAAAGTMPLVFKGGDFQKRYWPFAVSASADIDILLPRTHLGVARASLYSNGYRQAKFDRKQGRLIDGDVVEIGEVEAGHYELFPFCRLEPIVLAPDEREAADGRNLPLFIDARDAFLIVEIDVHHRVSVDLESEPLIERSRSSPYGHGLSMSAEDHLWFTTSRLYTETAIHGKRSLRDFAFLLSLLANETIDWDALLAIAREYELHAALYYYFHFLAFLGGPIPAGVLEQLSPRHSRRLRDWGWQLSVLFDWVDPAPFGPV